MSADQRPAETAAYQHAQDEAALAVSQMTDPGVTGPAQMDLPPVPAAGSKHTGPP